MNLPLIQRGHAGIHPIWLRPAAALCTYPNLDWIAPNLEIADLAARFRALHGLRTPDALQAATAAQAKVTGFITNDAVFQRVDAFATLVLDEVL